MRAPRPNANVRCCTVALLLTTLVTPACLGVTWRRTLVHQELPEEATLDLPRSGLSLEECLTRLGAPTFAQESDVHGLILAWSWIHEQNLGAQVSVPVSDWQSASFSYSDIRADEEGFVLWFDEGWVLRDWRRGYLRQLVSEAPRSARVEDLE